jgi:hypothetical protein
MKMPCLFVLVLAIVGCNSGRPHTAALAPGQATELARKLANDKAQALYNCRPFSGAPSAQLVEDRWVWQDRRGHGQVDLEATVQFAKDGADPSVRVVLLDSRPPRMHFY